MKPISINTHIDCPSNSKCSVRYIPKATARSLESVLLEHFLLEKVVIVFHHPPKGDQTEEFDCWVLHWFVHVTEEGPEEGLFSALNGGG